MGAARASWIGGVSLALAVGCGYPKPAELGGDGGCTDDQQQCDGLELEVCQGGTFHDSQLCANNCDATLGCTTCKPGTGTCNGTMAHTCDAAGSAFDDILCDATEGVTCDADVGACVGACAPAMLGSSNVGCEFYPTVTANEVSSAFDFGIVITNAQAIAASITISQGALASPLSLTVPAGGTVTQALPWQFALKLCGAGDPSSDGCTPATGALATAGAYHLVSNVPVAVVQLNTLEVEIAGAFSYSNDASLLMPTNTWRTEYYVASYAGVAGAPPNPGFPSLLAVTAPRAGANVTIDTTAATVAGGGVPAFAAGSAQGVALHPSDVVELTAMGDLTGTHVTSDQPVQVIGGHMCALVPLGNEACDHLEDAMFSVDALGRHYIINAPQIPGSPNGRVEGIRIIATAPNTHLVMTPAPSGAGNLIANAGGFVDIVDTATSFDLQADQKILVAQYMDGAGTTGATMGDPSMTLAVPVEQFRTSYLFVAPTTYADNYVDVTAPVGATIRLDGVPLAFASLDATFALSRATLTAGPAANGSHTITGDMPFGIQVYGVDQYTSYWYPGGTNLSSVP